ncbi:uncharacterized protein G2W53_030871 [Senna tora]|uniref:Uncharacterized protein n=1 Tax=Senna tora TaxID=362788 RepID=A0A834T9T0_9FABA|nr:uncharacterized protein G2W53_030871 [Senna tora]
MAHGSTQWPSNLNHGATYKL